VADAIVVRPARSGTIPAALLASLTVFIAGAVVGYSSIGPEWAAESLTAAAPEAEAVQPTAWHILLRNVSALMLLYSGALTVGVTSLLGLAAVAAYVGATMAVGVWNQGVWRLLVETGAYAPIEFAGLVVGGAAGLYPAVALARAIFVTPGSVALVGTYLDALRTSLKIFAWAVALVLVAATVEGLVIALR
jgi:uncharacterized membrane protein SpoIIM required for sporulation